jgi:hypothetical protein
MAASLLFLFSISIPVQNGIWFAEDGFVMFVCTIKWNKARLVFIVLLVCRNSRSAYLRLANSSGQNAVGISRRQRPR